MNNGFGTFLTGLPLVLGAVALFVFAIVLFVAPIKLYGIHREILRTNELLSKQLTVLAEMGRRGQAQIGLLTAITNTFTDQSGNDADEWEKFTHGSPPQPSGDRDA